MAIIQCPFRFNDEDTSCIVKDCAWWNEWLGICGIIVVGWLIGREVSIEEARNDSRTSESE